MHIWIVTLSSLFGGENTTEPLKRCTVDSLGDIIQTD